jgi:hypothetical protein
MGEDDEGGLAVEGRRQIRDRNGESIARADEGEPAAGRREVQRRAQDVEVRGKVEVVGDDARAGRIGPEDGHDELEEIDRSRIRDDHLIGRGADETRDLGAHPLRKIEPARVPTADEMLSPLLIDEMPGTLHARRRQAPQRIAVQVDPSGIRDEKAIPERGQRIARIQPAGVLPIGGNAHPCSALRS